jgi:ATP-dependent RNA helicase SUPV3L1/SUV3
VLGFHVCGPRAVRVDMLERLADLIRTLLAWRLDPANPGTPPRGAAGGGGFKATPDMMSILGCSANELGNVLRALGFWAERRRLIPPPAEAVAAGAVEAAAGGPSVAAALGDAPETAPTSPEPTLATVEPASTPASAEAAPDAASAAPIAIAAEPEAEKWEEIWRPRRKGRTFEAGAERHKQPQRPHHTKRAQQESRPKPAQQEGKSRPRRQNARRGAPPGQREERQRIPLQASPPKAAAFDPDSPFAALSSLKAALEKRSQD